MLFLFTKAIKTPFYREKIFVNRLKFNDWVRSRAL